MALIQKAAPPDVHWMVRMNRRNRSIHFTLLGLCAASHMFTQEGTAPWKWGLLAFQFLLYPQVLYYLTRSLPKERQRTVELRNMLLDGICFGLWAGLLGLPLWWTFTLYMGVSVNLMSFANIKGWGQATVSMALGIAAAQLLAPAPLSAATNALTTALCAFTLGLYILSVGNDTYRRASALHQQRRQLRLQLEENHQLQVKLSEQATSDPLTGLYNRRHLNSELQRLLTETADKHSSTALLLIDVDYFKQINDQYGHMAGDEVLHTVAAQLRSNSRASDMAFRYGGDEFLLVLRDISAEKALERAQHLCRQVASMRFSASGNPFSVSLSCGLAIYPTHASDEASLIHRADQALYMTKSRGRNGVTLFEPELEMLADAAK